VGFEADDEILQDFLVSSQEILESLDKQLVELEQRPQDTDLLNAVFRGFHTIKGGAGFLNLTAMVEVCHRAEDVFNLLRRGEAQVSPTLMDVVLRAFDVIRAMFEQAQARESLTPAEPALLKQLEALMKPGAAVAAPTPPPAPAAPVAPASDEITDAEFEQLLDALGSGKQPPAASATPPSTPAVATTAAPAAGGETASSASLHSGPRLDPGGDITDDEFEKLLDQMHGRGQAPGAATATPAPEPKGPAPAAPVSESTRHEPKPTEIKAAPVVDIKDREPKPAVRTEAAPAAEQETTVRVDTKRLDDIMNMVGELVLVRNRLVNLQAASADEKIVKAVGDLNRATSDLQAVVMKTRMQPIKKVYGRFPRVVRDLARQLKKEVNLELRGEETEVDKNLVEMLYDPLVHLVRNAIDHGVETPERRAAAGKSRTGTVVLSADQVGDHIQITITDDGAGMDPEILRRKVVEKGLLDNDAAQRLTASECYNLIFLPGFSTKSEISDVSGRGVGMDVVRTKIAQLNGTVDIDSEIAKGSRFLIKVPLTLAIMPTLMVGVGHQIFALPLVAVGEILHLNLTHIHIVDGQQMVMIRDQTLPIFYLRHWFERMHANPSLPSEGHVVVVQAGSLRVGLLVDRLVGQEEVVIKPLGTGLHGTTPGVAGATITGDGHIALILDLPVLIRRYARKDFNLPAPRPAADDAREVA
jgi:two-component system chemotaxis sensor kinase CheA